MAGFWFSLILIVGMALWTWEYRITKVVVVLFILALLWAAAKQQQQRQRIMEREAAKTAVEEGEKEEAPSEEVKEDAFPTGEASPAFLKSVKGRKGKRKSGSLIPAPK